MKTMIYPGSFDPLTNGHMDIIRRAAKLCDVLVVAVLTNKSKQACFSKEERLEMVKDAAGDIPGVEIVTFDGLLVELVRKLDARAVIRGLRSESDFRFEAEMAAANKLMLPTYETCLLPCRIDLAFTSSSIVREVASYGGDISSMVPDIIAGKVSRKLSPRDYSPQQERQQEDK